MPVPSEVFRKVISRRTALTLPLMLLAAGLPIGAWAMDDPRPLRISLSLRPESLDPTCAPSAAIGEIVHGNILEGLIHIQENGTAAPLLATGWEISDDHLLYRFQLQDNVSFHDGAPLNAQVVAYSLQRAKALGSANKLAETFRNIRVITTPDAHTVELVLHHPDPFLLLRLGESPAAILHPDTADQAVRHPIGTGPYRLAQWHAEGQIDLTRWAGFRHADQVRIAAASFSFIPDPDQQIQAVLDQRTDLLFSAATGNVDRLIASREYEILVGSSSGKGMVAINHRHKPLDDLRVRQAITHAIDREAFIREALHGRGRTIGSHFVPTDPDYINLTAMYPYDPSRARSLLRKAGVHTPLSLDLALPPTPYAIAGGPVVARYLAAIGIQVRLVQTTWAQWVSGVFNGHFDLSLILHVEPLDYTIYTQPDYYFGYDSPTFRALVNRHTTSTNPREQGRLFREIQRQLADDAVNAWIFTPEVSTVVRKGLKGVQMDYPVFAHDIGAMYWQSLGQDKKS